MIQGNSTNFGNSNHRLHYLLIWHLRQMTSCGQFRRRLKSHLF